MNIFLAFPFVKAVVMHGGMRVKMTTLVLKIGVETSNGTKVSHFHLHLWMISALRDLLINTNMESSLYLIII